MPEILTRKGTLAVAPGAPASFDPERRTVELIWTTGAAIERNGRRPDGNYGTAWLEELGTGPGEVDLSRLNAGAPLLNAHAAWDVRDVIGVVERASMSGGRGTAVVRFSDWPDVEPIARDVAGGILRNVSVGYQVLAWQEVTPPGAERRHYRATSWQPMELSLVPIPADAGAQTRSQPRPEGFPMETQTAAPAAPAVASAAADPVLAERARVEGITDQCERAGIPAETRRRYIAEGRSIEFVRGVSQEVIVQREEATAIVSHTGIEVRGGYDATDPRGLTDAMAEGIVARRRPDLVKLERGSRGAVYRGMTDDDVLRELLGDRRATLRTVVLGGPMSRAHTTSDFPLLLENIGNKALLAAYELVAPSYRMIAAQRSFADFRPQNFLRGADFPAPLLNGESMEIEQGPLSDASKESVRAYRYARRVGLSREVLVNDGLGGLAEPSAMAGRRCADLENSLVYAQLALNSGSGPTLRDGNAMCTTTRGNKAASGTAIDATNIGAGRAAMRGLASPDGLKLNVTPAVLACGAAKEHQAFQVITAATVPSTDAETNPYKGRMDVVADANIAGNNWYLFANPAAFSGLIWGYVDGYEGPRFETQEAWTTDGVEYRVMLYFGAGAVDWRGVYHNPGA